MSHQQGSSSSASHHHSLGSESDCRASARKRHSPNQPSISTSATATLNATAAPSDSTHSSKVRKISSATSSVSKANKSGDGIQDKALSEPHIERSEATNSSASGSGSRRSGPAELHDLIDYFPDRPNTDGSRLTRSKAKALQGQTQQSGKGDGNSDGASGGSKNSGKASGSSHHQTTQGNSKKQSTQQQPQVTSTSTATEPQQTAAQDSRQRATSFLTSLVPRMQHLLNTGGGGGTAAEMNAEFIDTTTSAYQFAHGHHHHHVSTPAVLSIVEGLKSNNEIRQSESASELAEILLLGNEESLPNMPIVEIVQSLCTLLQKDHNFELMLTAARCITNMQEALPRALPVIAEAIPLLLQKLKRIEYIDVAEQSLIALEVMSRRNAKNILAAGGIASTISHVDFFSLPSQRLAFSIAANCASCVSHNEFPLVKDCLPDLTQRLVYVDDRRILESICIFFNRIVENLRQHPDKLRLIAGTNFEFLNNVQKLLAIQPSNISSNTYLALLKSLRYICSQSCDAALALVRMEFGNTIRFLLVGPERTDRDIEKIEKGSSSEMPHSVDLTLRPTQQLREIITLVGQIVQKLPPGSKEVISLLHLFPLFVEIGTNSTCSQLRHDSLNVMMKMCCAVEKSDQLEPILRDIPLAVYIAAMLSSNRNLGVLASALQLAKVLLKKLPKMYIPLFEAEGVFHEIRRLTEPIASPVIDRKPESMSARAEQILEGLVNSSSQSGSGNVRVLIPQMLFGQASSGSSSSSSTNAQNHQQMIQQQQEMVCNLAKQIIERFAGEEATKKYGIKEPQKSQKIYDKLCALTAKLRQEKDTGYEPLNMLKHFLLDSSSGVPTSFQFNQSGIVPALIKYLTDSSDKMQPTRTLRLKRFAAVFFDLKADKLDTDSFDAERFVSFERLAAKLLSTIATIEQFQVRITNLSGIITGGSNSLSSYQSALLGAGGPTALISTTLRGAQALRFFQTHQIRCNLRRHPSSKNIKEWRHGRGSIKVDPFTSVSAIERYLIERGAGAVSLGQAHGQQSSDGDDDSDDISDEDLSFTSTLTTDGHIELYIGEHRLPSEISILQAIRQFSLPQDEENAETIPSSIWLTTHTIYYKNPTLESQSTQSSSSSSSLPAINKEKGPSTSKDKDKVPPAILTHQPDDKKISISTALVDSEQQSSSTTPSSKSIRTRSRQQKLYGIVKQQKDGEGTSHSTAHIEAHPLPKIGKIPKRASPLEAYLKPQLDCDINDPSQNCLILLQVLYGLNIYWWELFGIDEADEIHPPATYKSLISQSSFHSSKLNSKVTRQLCDFLTVATQQIPKWTLDLVKAVPFLFNFSTRRSFLFCTAFGRDRALMHLVNETSNDEQEGVGHDAASRLIPRLERRKVQIKRDNLLKDAQQIFSQINTSKAMLEVGFNGEVGTGFGPTLEFYSTLSRALQKNSLRLWNGKVQKCAESERDGTGDDEYVFAAHGLYPEMNSRSLTPKQNEQRIKRFEFIGRLLAQTIIDSRMLDLDLAPPVFKWLIGEEATLGAEDFEKLEPTIYRSLRNIIQTPAEDMEDLQVYFTYPGEPSIELIKGGKNVQVTKDNCKQFMELVCYWRLIEGVRPEMEALRRGFQVVINKDSLRIFTSDEISELFCGNNDADDKAWSKSVLQHAIRPDHGYSYDSQQIKWLIDMLHGFSREKRRHFLQFCTGSPRLPVGGFKGLSPPLTVVKKTSSYDGNEHELPSAMTCYNYLKIPPYETYKIFVDRFEVALQHVYSFFLT